MGWASRTQANTGSSRPDRPQWTLEILTASGPRVIGLHVDSHYHHRSLLRVGVFREAVVDGQTRFYFPPPYDDVWIADDVDVRLMPAGDLHEIAYAIEHFMAE